MHDMNTVFKISILIRDVRGVTPIVIEADQLSVLQSEMVAQMQAAINVKAASIAPIQQTVDAANAGMQS